MIDNLINRLEQTEMRAVLEEERRVRGRQNVEPLAATSSVTALQIAEVLGVNVEDIQFGTNLINETGFEIPLDESSIWLPIYQFDPSQQQKALYFIGLDDYRPYAGHSSIRIQGIWTPSYVRAGPWLDMPKAIHAGAGCYLFQVAYRTEPSVGSGQVLIYGGPWRGYYDLPPTAGEWFEASILGCIPQGQTGRFLPFLSFVGLGSAWYD